MNLARFDRFRSPELQYRLADNAPVTEFHQLLEQRQRAGIDERGQSRLRGGDIDGGTGEDQLAYLGGKARGVEQRHPSALAKSNKIDAPAEVADQHIKSGEIVVDGKETHVRVGRAPMGHEQAPEPRL